MSRNLETERAVNAALSLLVFGGMLGVMIIAPGGLQIFEPIIKGLDKRQKELESKRLLRYMVGQKLITKQRTGDGNYQIRTTHKGATRAQINYFKCLRIKPVKPWDGSWRVLSFDIPETHRGVRSALRNKLRELGFFQLHKSVWVQPYSCAAEVAVIRQVLNLKPDQLTFLEVSWIDRERQLRAHFKLDD